MEQYKNRRRALWLLAGVSAVLICAAAFLRAAAGRGDIRGPLPRETVEAETAEEHHRAEEPERMRMKASGGSSSEAEGKAGQRAVSAGEQGELPAGISAGQVKSQEEGYCLVSENGFLFVFAKDRSDICLDTHMPLSEFPLSEQERLLDGVWFSSMLEVFHYLESYTS